MREFRVLFIPRKDSSIKYHWRKCPAQAFCDQTVLSFTALCPDALGVVQFQNCLAVIVLTSWVTSSNKSQPTEFRPPLVSTLPQQEVLFERSQQHCLDVISKFWMMYFSTQNAKRIREAMSVENLVAVTRFCSHLHWHICLCWVVYKATSVGLGKAFGMWQGVFVFLEHAHTHAHTHTKVGKLIDKNNKAVLCLEGVCIYVD